MKITKTLVTALLFGMAVSSFGTAVAADKSNATSGSSWYDNVWGWTADQKKSYDNYATNKGLPTSDKLASGEAKLTSDQISTLQKDVGTSADGKIGNNTLDGLSKWSPSWSAWSTKLWGIASPGFMFDSSSISPSKKPYNQWSRWNLQALAENVSNLLLIGIATLAALLIAVAGLRMTVSSLNPDEAAKGKAMLKFNVMALAVALLSYALVNLVSWIISAT